MAAGPRARAVGTARTCAQHTAIARAPYTAPVSEPCRTGCREEGEPLAGTAGGAALAVSIEWPKPQWHHDDALLSDGIPDALRADAAELRARLGKISVRLFQRAPRPRTDRVEVIAWDPRARRALRRRDVPIADALSFATCALAGETAADPLPPLVLVCTDGRHDRCCAALGRGMYEAIAGEIARQQV